MTARGERGFTLMEVLIALSIVAAMLAIMLGGLGAGLSAWHRGSERAEGLEQRRGLAHLIAETLTATHPYRAADRPGEGARLLFEGEPQRVAFVTAAPPFPRPTPIAWTAVTLSLEERPTPALAVRQKPLPNREPFERVGPALVEPVVTHVRFRYSRDGGGWEDRWDAAQEKALPRAVEVTLTTAHQGRSVVHPPLVVPIHATAP